MCSIYKHEDNNPQRSQKDSTHKTPTSVLSETEKEMWVLLDNSVHDDLP